MAELRSRNTNRWVSGSVCGLVMIFALAVVGQESNLTEAPARATNDKYDSGSLTVSHRAVWLQPNGSFSGRLRRVDANSGQPFAVPGVSVYLIQNRQVIYRTTLDEIGHFAFNNVRHGVYSLLATGSSGFASFPVHVKPADQKATPKVTLNGTARARRNHKSLDALSQIQKGMSPVVLRFASQRDDPIPSKPAETDPDETVPPRTNRATLQIATQDVPPVEELEAFLIDPRDLAAAADFLQQFVPSSQDGFPNPPTNEGFGAGGGGGGSSGGGGGGGGGGGNGIGLASGLIPVLLGLSGSGNNGRSALGFRGGRPVTPTPPSQIPPPFPDFPPDLPPPPDPDPPPLISELKP